MTTESGAFPNCNFARYARIVDQQEYLGDKQATERGHNERYANSESCYGSWIMCAQPSSLPFTGQRRSVTSDPHQCWKWLQLWPFYSSTVLLWNSCQHRDRI